MKARILARTVLIASSWLLLFSTPLGATGGGGDADGVDVIPITSTDGKLNVTITVGPPTTDGKRPWVATGSMAGKNLDRASGWLGIDGDGNWTFPGLRLERRRDEGPFEDLNPPGAVRLYTSIDPDELGDGDAKDDPGGRYEDYGVGSPLGGGVVVY